MNNTFLVFIGLMIVALLSLGLATLFSLNVSVVYLVGLLIWFFGIQIHYKIQKFIRNKQESQQKTQK